MISSNFESKVDAESYDAHKRDPLYARAAHSRLWELVCSLFTFLFGFIENLL